MYLTLSDQDALVRVAPQSVEAEPSELGDALTPTDTSRSKSGGTTGKDLRVDP
jgi:hypothetical protein